MKVLANGKVKAGPHVVTCDGTDAEDGRLPICVYFDQMKSGEFLSTRKVLLIRQRGSGKEDFATGHLRGNFVRPITTRLTLQACPLKKSLDRNLRTY